MARALVLGFVAGHGALHPREHPAARGGQVRVAADAGQLDVVLVGQRDERFQLDGLAVQPVEIPHRDTVDDTASDVVAQRLVGAAAAGVGGHVVVAVFDGIVPPFGGAQGEQVFALAVDCQPVLVTVKRLTEVDGRFHNG